MTLNSFLNHDGLSYLWSKVVNRISSSETNITAKIPIASDDLPKDLGPSSSGISSKFSRSDHVHKVPDDIVSYTDAQTDVEENADIKTLIDRKTGKIIYPQTIARAIYDSYGKDLQTRLDELNQNYVATSPQNLTDAQQAQARGNINAAPGGFGLGTISQVVTDFDTVRLNGWYYGAVGTAHAPDSEHAWSVCVTNLVHNSEVCVQDAYALLTVNEYLHCRRLVYVNTATQNNPWEWVNFPVQLGVEYRTTERYLGKPVYTQIKQFDNLSTIQMYSPGGSIIRFSGETQWPYDDSGNWIPIIVSRLPNEEVISDLPNIDFNATYNFTIRIVLAANSKCLGKSARVQMWYTK